MSGVFDHLHIKRHTAGSSNELSCDVLDAARTDLDSRKSIGSRRPKMPKSYQGSYHGVMGTATFSGKAEVKKRKKARRVHALVVWVVGVFVALAAAFALLWFGYQHYLEVQDFSTRYDSLVNQFSDEDKLLSAVDMHMNSLDDASKEGERAALLAEIPEKAEGLNKIRQNAAHARPLANDDKDVHALSEIEQSVDDRLNMLSAAEEAFTLAAEKNARKNELGSLWNDVITESQDSLDAAESANRATTEKAVAEVRDKTESTLMRMQDSLASLRENVSREPLVDASSQISYVEAKVESLKLAVDTGDALLAGDREKASEKNEQYNAKDKEAALLADKLPTSLDEAVDAAYESALRESTAKYSAARDQVIQHDAFIREYIESR